jgi:SAM-dependent methyltransferase
MIDAVERPFNLDRSRQAVRLLHKTSKPAGMRESARKCLSPEAFRRAKTPHGEMLEVDLWGDCNGVLSPPAACSIIVETPDSPSKGLHVFEFVREVLNKLEQDESVDSRTKAIRGLRALGLDDFGEVLLSIPNPAYPKLSSLLPHMASQQVQESWTGSSGLTLLTQTLSFTRSVSYNYARLVGKTLTNASILDFGCGYGRIARLMYYFVDEDSFFGCDPWEKSIEICKQDGLSKNFLQSDYLPESLPVGDKKFDLIYAFSVFTHLSLRATKTALSTLRKYVADDGLLVITIRPIEYWDFAEKKRGLANTPELKHDHQHSGFAFKPHDRRPTIEGDITYGDTSMSFDWLRENFPEWTLTAIDRSLTDRHQIYVFLKPNG